MVSWKLPTLKIIHFFLILLAIVKGFFWDPFFRLLANPIRSSADNLTSSISFLLNVYVFPGDGETFKNQQFEIESGSGGGKEQLEEGATWSMWA